MLRAASGFSFGGGGGSKKAEFKCVICGLGFRVKGFDKSLNPQPNTLNPKTVYCAGPGDGSSWVALGPPLQA